MMPDGGCDAACVKIIIDGGALAGEAAAMYEALTRGSSVAQEAFALMQQVQVQGLVAGALTSKASAGVKSALLAMSDDQCAYAEKLRDYRDHMPFAINGVLHELRQKRLQYHYFLRDIALGEEPSWPYVES